MANNPIVMTPELFARMARMLRAFEGGAIRPSAGTAVSPGSTSSDSLTIKITSNASGGGRYIAQVMQPGTTDVVETGNVAESDFGTAYTPTVSGAKVLALNTAEKGLSTHAVAAGSIYNARIVRRNSTNATLAVSFTSGGSSLPTGTLYDVLSVVDTSGVFVPSEVRFK